MIYSPCGDNSNPPTKFWSALRKRVFWRYVVTMDDSEGAEALPQKRIVPVAGMRIGLIHVGKQARLRERLLARLRPGNTDIIVYGHSHVLSWGKSTAR